MPTLLVAASTQRTIGWTIAILVVVGFLVYLVLNVLAGRREAGSELELAPNRKPYYDDDVLETKRLDRSLVQALGLLAVVAVALPVYWLREPARQDNAADGLDRTFTSRGATLYEAQCSRCHGPDAGGGVAAYTITDENGDFVATVSWQAPALTSVLTRFDEDEVRHVLNYGRHGVMPAWGAPGGGPLTDQQITTLIYFLRSVQLDAETMADEVLGGVETLVAERLVEEDPGLADDQDALAAAVEDELDEITDPDSPRFVEYGELLFNNPAGQGAYNCARCHTTGWSYGADSDEGVAELIDEWPNLESSGALTEYAPGSGFFGWNLTGGSTVTKFPSAEEHAAFIASGSQQGVNYGNGGQGGSGQMPGFAARVDDDAGREYAAILSPEQIDAVVAYERGL